MPSISALDRKKVCSVSADLVLEALLVCESPTEYKQGIALVAQEAAPRDRRGAKMRVLP